MGWPPHMPEPVRANAGAAGDIRRSGVEGRERPQGIALCDDPVGDGREGVEDRAGRASLQVRGRVAGMGGDSPDRRSGIVRRRWTSKTKSRLANLDCE